MGLFTGDKRPRVRIEEEIERQVRAVHAQIEDDMEKKFIRRKQWEEQRRAEQEAEEKLEAEIREKLEARAEEAKNVVVCQFHFEKPGHYLCLNGIVGEINTAYCCGKGYNVFDPTGKCSSWDDNHGCIEILIMKKAAGIDKGKK